MKDFTMIFGLSAFKCVACGRDLNIPVVLPVEYLKTSEEIIRNSYDHSETFSSVRKEVNIEIIVLQTGVNHYKIFYFLQAILLHGNTSNMTIMKPALTNRQKIIQAIIRYSGIVVNVRTMVKNICQMTTHC